MFECVQVLGYGWTLPQGLFVFFKNTVLYFLVYTSPVLRVDAPAGAFCVLQKHLLIFLSVYKSCATGGHSRKDFLFSSKTPSYILECIQVLCYGWTLPQGLFVLFKNTFLYFWVYTSPVLRVDAPAGAFCFLQKHLLIFLSVGQDDVSSARASQRWPRPPQPPSAAGAIAWCFFCFFV